MKKKTRAFVSCLTTMSILLTGCASTSKTILTITPPEANPIADEARCKWDFFVEYDEEFEAEYAHFDRKSAECLTKMLAHLKERPKLEQDTLDDFAEVAEEKAGLRETKARVQGGEGKITIWKSGTITGATAFVALVLGFVFGKAVK